MADLPNPWSVHQELLKTVFTLASALIAVTVTLWHQIEPTHATNFSRAWVTLAWLGSFLALLLAVIASSKIIDYLNDNEKTKSRANKAIFFTNACLYSLVLSGGFFLLFGVSQVWDRYRGESADASIAWAVASDLVAEKLNVPQHEVKVVSLDQSVDKNNFIIKLIAGQIEPVILVDTQTGKITAYKLQ